MLFILYSEVDAVSIGAKLGTSEYSYYFVLKGFQRVLSSLGEVIIVESAKEADLIYLEQQASRRCLFISFSPPHKVILPSQCPAICVFAWEFSNIPCEVWDDEPRNDWRTVLSQLAGAITLSTQTAQLVKEVMGAEYPVSAIPVPVYGELHGKDINPMGRDPQLGRRSLFASCSMIDSSFYEIGTEDFRVITAPQLSSPIVTDGHNIELNFRLDAEGSGLLGGFYGSEPWGTWSRIAAPWILLPFTLKGRLRLGIEYAAYGHNVCKVASLRLGKQVFPLPMMDQFIFSEFDIDLESPVNLIQFENLNVSAVPNAPDPRSMGIGLRRIVIDSDASISRNTLSTQTLELDGVVYASVLNPGDNRKNWIEMLTAFCYAFKSEPRATLLLKMTHKSVSSFLGQFHYMLQRIGKVQCRIVLLHGYLDDPAYHTLMDVATYYINTSHCEGLCLPMMEFMSCGVPAVSPNHTAMSDYINSANAFIVDSFVEPAIWPHDTRELLRTTRYRLDWESLVTAYCESFRVAIDVPMQYHRMSERASVSQFEFCSFGVVREHLQNFLAVGNCKASSRCERNDESLYSGAQ